MPNFDENTGIRYGIVSPHSISSFALDDMYQNGTDTICESGKQELLDDIKQFCEDHNLNFDRIDTNSFEDQYYEPYENPDGQMDYSDSEYDLHVSGYNFGIFVMRSPYYTYCRDCSPCAPGAGSLDSPVDPVNLDLSTLEHISGKTLCLGYEWFDQDNDQYSRKIPYRVFRVDNDEEVLPGDQV
jgi:hypothetical protein